MSDVAHMTNHVERALSRLMSYFPKDGSVAGLVEVAAQRVQELEDVFFSFYAADAIDTAEGEQLDTLGDIVGQARGGLSDADYRIWISARIAVNQSSGTAPELIHIASLLIEDADPHYTPSPPAGFILEAVGAAASDGAEVAGLFLSAVAAGVKGVFTWSDVEPAEQLILNSSTAGQRLNEGALAHSWSNA